MTKMFTRVPRLALLAGTITIMAIAGAEARAARIAVPAPQPDENAYMTSERPTTISHPILNRTPVSSGCEVSYMQVPSIGGGLVWKQVDDCDAD